jgi:hypothetical protein
MADDDGDIGRVVYGYGITISIIASGLPVWAYEKV